MASKHSDIPWGDWHCPNSDIGEHLGLFYKVFWKIVTGSIRLMNLEGWLVGCIAARNIV